MYINYSNYLFEHVKISTKNYLFEHVKISTKNYNGCFFVKYMRVISVLVN